MARAHLKLAPAVGWSAPQGQVARWPGFLIGGICLAAASLATFLGADAARRPAPTPERALETVSVALAQGNESPEVREAVRSFRSQLGARPLDSATRVLYASVLLELASRAEDSAAPAFHARRAATLAPVTVPIVSAAALVLVRSGEPEQALALTRAMFGYDARAAAPLLRQIEPFLGGDGVRGALPDDPDAWNAWAEQLVLSERREQAEAWLREGLERWPGHVGLREALCHRAIARGDWNALEALLPEDLAMPRSADAAELFAYRAWLRVERGQLAAARGDLEEAGRLSRDSSSILVLSGDVLYAAADFDGARSYWSRALYRVPPGERSRPAKLGILVRLARLEDRRGMLGEALRAWRAVLRVDPDHEEAGRRVSALALGPR